MRATSTAYEFLNELLISRHQWNLLALGKGSIRCIVRGDAPPNSQIERLLCETLRRNRQKCQVGESMQIFPRNISGQAVTSNRLPQHVGAFDIEQVGNPELNPSDLARSSKSLSAWSDNGSFKQQLDADAGVHDTAQRSLIHRERSSRRSVVLSGVPDGRVMRLILSCSSSSRCERWCFNVFTAFCSRTTTCAPNERLSVSASSWSCSVQIVWYVADVKRCHQEPPCRITIYHRCLQTATNASPSQSFLSNPSVLHVTASGCAEDQIIPMAQYAMMPHQRLQTQPANAPTWSSPPHPRVVYPRVRGPFSAAFAANSVIAEIRHLELRGRAVQVERGALLGRLDGAIVEGVLATPTCPQNILRYRDGLYLRFWTRKILRGLGAHEPGEGTSWEHEREQTCEGQLSNHKRRP